MDSNNYTGEAGMTDKERVEAIGITPFAESLNHAASLSRTYLNPSREIFGTVNMVTDRTLTMNSNMMAWAMAKGFSFKQLTELYHRPIDDSAPAFDPATDKLDPEKSSYKEVAEAFIADVKAHPTVPVSAETAKEKNIPEVSEKTSKDNLAYWGGIYERATREFGKYTMPDIDYKSIDALNQHAEEFNLARALSIDIDQEFGRIAGGFHGDRYYDFLQGMSDGERSRSEASQVCTTVESLLGTMMGFAFNTKPDALFYSPIKMMQLDKYQKDFKGKSINDLTFRNDENWSYIAYAGSQLIAEPELQEMDDELSRDEKEAKLADIGNYLKKGEISDNIADEISVMKDTFDSREPELVTERMMSEANKIDRQMKDVRGSLKDIMPTLNAVKDTPPDQMDAETMESIERQFMKTVETGYSQAVLQTFSKNSPTGDGTFIDSFKINGKNVKQGLSEKYPEASGKQLDKYARVEIMKAFGDPMSVVEYPNLTYDKEKKRFDLTDKVNSYPVMEKSQPKLDEFGKRLDKLLKSRPDGSEYFIRMKNAINNLKKMDTLSPEDVSSNLNELSLAAKEYHDKRKGIIFGPFSKNGKDRLALANDINAFVDEMKPEFDRFKENYPPKERVNLEKKLAEAGAEHKKAKEAGNKEGMQNAVAKGVYLSQLMELRDKGRFLDNPTALDRACDDKMIEQGVKELRADKDYAAAEAKGRSISNIRQAYTDIKNSKKNKNTFIEREDGHMHELSDTEKSMLNNFHHVYGFKPTWNNEWTNLKFNDENWRKLKPVSSPLKYADGKKVDERDFEACCYATARDAEQVMKQMNHPDFDDKYTAEERNYGFSTLYSNDIMAHSHPRDGVGNYADNMQVTREVTENAFREYAKGNKEPLGRVIGIGMNSILKDYRSESSISEGWVTGTEMAMRMDNMLKKDPALLAEAEKHGYSKKDQAELSGYAAAAGIYSKHQIANDKLLQERDGKLTLSPEDKKKYVRDYTQGNMLNELYRKYMNKYEITPDIPALMQEAKDRGLGDTAYQNLMLRELKHNENTCPFIAEMKDPEKVKSFEQMADKLTERAGLTKLSFRELNDPKLKMVNLMNTHLKEEKLVKDNLAAKKAPVVKNSEPAMRK